MKYMNKPILVLGLLISGLTLIVYGINFSSNSKMIKQYNKELSTAETIKQYLNIECFGLVSYDQFNELATCIGKQLNNDDEIKKYNGYIKKIEEDVESNEALLVASFIFLLSTVIISFSVGYFTLNRKKKESDINDSGVESRLLKLKELYDKKLITEELYESRKKEIMSEL